MGKKKPESPAKETKAKPSETKPKCPVEVAKNAKEGCKGKGLADPDQIELFVKDFKSQVMKDWDTMTADERFAAVKKLTEKQFDDIGVPKPTIDRSKDAAAGFDNPPTLFGEAHADDWGFTFNGNIFDKSPLSEHDQKELAKTMMHESRHIEQYYKIAQYRAAQGDTADDIITNETDTHEKVSIPKEIAEKAAKDPLPKTGEGGAECDNTKKAKEWWDAKYGKGDLSQYRPEVAYRDRPLEKDAWGLEPTIDAKW
jgi:hypothetical protein